MGGELMKGKILVFNAKSGEKIFKEILSSKPITRTQERKRRREAIKALRRQGFYM